ncbi:MAG TPA: NAD(P)-binding protein, partial [Pseudonocardiaceae bacterium]
MSIRVVIIGGGIGGLCLAQSLHQAGVQVQVFERDRTPTSRLHGYRLHINPRGHQALHDCLPDPVYRRFAASAARPPATSAFHFVDEQLRELCTVDTSRPPAATSSAAPWREHTAISRAALREVL